MRRFFDYHRFQFKKFEGFLQQPFLKRALKSGGLLSFYKFKAFEMVF